MKPLFSTGRIFLATTIFSLLLASLPAHATVCNWTNTAGGNWSNTNNWSPNQVPGPSDAAFITNSGTYTVSLAAQNLTAASLTVGTATGPGTQSLSMNGFDFVLPASFVVNASGAFNLNGGTLYGNGTIQGVLTWTGGQFGSGNNHLTIQTNGTLVLAGGAGTNYSIGEAVTNAGTIQIRSGNLLINYCGSSYGALYSLPGAVIDFQSDGEINQSCGGLNFVNQGIIRKSAGTGVSALNAVWQNYGEVDVEAGKLVLNGGTSDFGGIYVGAGTTEITNSTFAENGTMISSNFVVAGGTFSCSGTLQGTFTWAGGQFGSGNHSMTLTTNSTLVLAGVNGVNYSMGQILTNAGVIRVVSGNLLINWCGGGDYGELHNLPGAVIDLAGDVSISGDSCTPGLFNSGTVLKSAGTGVSIIAPSFHNSGTVSVQTGTLLLNGPTSDASGYYAGPGTVLITNATFAETGTLVTTNFVLAGGTFSCNGTIQGLVTWTGGEFGHGNPVMNLATNSTLLLAGASGVNYSMGQNLNNAGLIRVVSGNLLINYCGDYGQLNNLPGAVIDLAGDVSISGDSCTPGLFNSGTVLKSAGAGVSIIAPRFHNSGTVSVQTGTLLLNGPTSDTSGYYTGPGTVLITNATFAETGTLVTTNLVLAGGTLYGNGSIKGSVTWTGGLFGTGNNALTLTTNSTLVLAGVNGVSYSMAQILTNAGVIRVVSGNLLINWCGGGDYGELHNLPGAVIDLAGDVSISGDSCTPGLFNSGTVLKSAGTGVSVIAPRLNNSGTVSVQTGTVLLNGPTADNSGSYLGPGTLVISNTAFAEAGTLVTTNNVVLARGTFSGNLSIGGVFTWTGGQLGAGSAPITIGSTARLLLQGVPGTNYTLGQPWSNAGLVRVLGGNLLATGASFTNTGTVDLESGSLSLKGNYSLDSGSVNLAINSATNFGALSLAGPVALPGTIGVTLNDSFVPVPGSRFPILSFASHSGKFTAAHLPVGASFSYTSTSATLVWNGITEATWAAGSPVLHGMITVAFLVNPGTVVQLVAKAGGASYILGATTNSGFSTISFSTAQLPSGPYTLVALVYDAAGQLVGNFSRSAFVNNSLAWHEGILSASQTWGSNLVHAVDQDVIIPSGVILTLAPGAIVKFAAGTGIIILSGGILDASGATANAAIILTSLADDSAGGDSNEDGNSSVPQPGDWNGITDSGQFKSSAYVQIRYVSQIVNGTLTGNQEWSGTVDHLVDGNLTIPSGVTLTIDPGAIVKFYSGGGFTVSTGATLIVEGTYAQPITFTSIKDDTVGGDSNDDGNSTTPAPGDWNSIYIGGGTGLFDHVSVAYGASQNLPSGLITSTANGSVVHIANSVLSQGLYNGIQAAAGTVTVSNCVVTDCDRGIQAGLLGNARLTVVNCTLDANGIGMFLHGGTANVANTIIADSLVAGIADCCGSTVASFRYNNVWSATGTYGSLTWPFPNQTGQNGNISADPKFINPAQGNYQLNYGSPCIDSADGAGASLTDLTGAPRYNDPRTLAKTGVANASGLYPDMGAFEFVATASSPVDLIASLVDGPLSETAGQTVTVQWNDVNIGTGDAVGPWHDTIYLAPAGGAGEPLFVGETLVAQGVVLGPRQAYAASATVTVPAGEEGTYQWQVHVNSRGDIFEGVNWTNNVAVGTTPTILTLPALTIDGPPVAGQFSASGQINGYKLTGNTAQPVLLALQGAGAGSALELYVGQGYLPDQTHFDFKSGQFDASSVSLQLNQTTGVVYYVAAYARSLAASALNYTLSATTPVFSVTSVNPSSIANTGTVTLQINGSSLSAADTYQLIGAGGTFTATGVTVVDPTTAYAAFSLGGAATGSYTVQVTDLSAVRHSLTGAVQVVAAVASNLSLQLQLPPWFRVGRVFNGTVTYANAGNADMIAPIIRVSAGGQAQLRLLPSDSFSSNDLLLLGVSFQGPAGVLRAGQTWNIPFSALCGANLSPQFNVLEITAESSELVDYTALGPQVRPAGYSDAEWLALWNLFQAEAGPTWGGFVSLMASLATEMSQANLTAAGAGVFYSLPDLLAFAAGKQVQTTLAGTLYLNSSAHPLAGTQVAAWNADGSQEGVTQSAADGSFVILNVTNDTFNLSVPGYWLPQPVQATMPASGSVTGLTVVVRAGGSFTGLVTSQSGGAALSNILVEAVSEGTNGQFAVNTDMNGAFALAGLPPDTYDLAIGGYPHTVVQLNGLSITNGQVLATNAVLGLSPAAAIAGYVVANGAPVAGALVQLADALTNVTDAATDPNGYFLCAGGAAGPYTLTVTETGFVPYVLATNLAASAVANAGTIVLVPGASISVDLNSGTTNALAGALVTLLQNGNIVSQQYAAANGWVSFNDLAAGTYAVLAQVDGFQSSSNTVVVGTGASISNTPALTQLGSISGGLTDGNGQPIAGIEVNVFGLDPATEAIAFGTTTDTNGQYALVGLPAGRYEVTVGNNGGIDLRQVTIDASLAPVTVNLSLAASVVQGQVFRSDGVTPVEFETVSFAQGNQLLATALTDTNGVYVFRVLLPGVYELFVATSFDLSSNLTVTVPANTNLVVAPLVLGSLQLSGRVTDGSGQAASNAFVQVLAPGSSAAGLNALTDTNGSFTVSGLVAGEYRLLIEQLGLVPLWQSLTVLANTNQNFVLSAGVTVTGRITDAATGLAVSNASVAFIGRSSQFPAAFGVSDTNGNYTAYYVAATNYDVVISEDGHQLQELPNIAVTGTSFVLNANLSATNAVVQGMVTAPVTNAVVRISDTNTGDVLLQLQPDIHGHWATTQLAAGSYQVIVTALGYLPPSPVTITVSGALTTVSPLVLVPVATDDGEGVFYAATQFLGRELLAHYGIEQPVCFDLPVPPQAKVCELCRNGYLYHDQPALSLFLQVLDDEKIAGLACQQWKESYDGQSAITGANGGLAAVQAAQTLASLAKLTFPAASIVDKAGKETLEGLSAAAVEAGVADIATMAKAYADINKLTSSWPDTTSKLKAAFDSGDPAKIAAGVGEFVNTVAGSADALNKFVNISLGGSAASVSPWLSFLNDILKFYNTTKKALDSFNAAFSAYDKSHDTYVQAVKRYQKDEVAYLAANHCPQPPPDICDCMPNPYCCRHPQDCSCNPNPNCCLHPEQCKPQPKQASDPNDKLNTGFGPAGFVHASAPILFVVDFENQPTATAPAQQVTISDLLDTNLDWSTFQLLAISFNNVSLAVPAGLQNFGAQTSVATDPNPVQVLATFNPSSGLATWQIESINPVTGQLVTDPLAGFLPPDNTNRVGEGYVVYSVRPKAGLPNGTRLLNQASIVFDVNSPILTPVTTNTIDADPPSSSVTALPAIIPSTNFVVSWFASDGTGSGVASYDVYVSDNGGPWTQWLADTTNYLAVFTGTNGHTYGFYSIATDNVGNMESKTPLAEAQTLVPILILTPPSTVLAAKTSTNTVSVTDLGGAAWNVVNTNTWIHILAGGSGNSNGLVKYSVVANTNLAYRVGTMTILDQTFAVLQRGSDPTPPALTIKAPTANQRWSNAVFTALGTASDNRGVTNVWYQFNNNAWTNATTTNHWTNWTAQLTLTPGTNVLRAYAWDLSANSSPTNTVRFSYVVTNALQLQIVGKGKVTGATNGQVLEIGRSYTITATPAAGFVLTNWSGGVTGHSATLTFTMQSNLLVVATFADVQRPLLAITAPKASQRITNSLTPVTITGTASDNDQVTNVVCLLGGTALPGVMTVNGWTNWTVSLTPPAGTNALTAYARDRSGNYSLTNKVSFFYVVPSPLRLVTNGVGSITRNFTGNVLEVGRGYTVTGMPAAGNLFSNWVGSVTSSSATLNFLMQSNMLLQANFVTNPFIAEKGTYTGLFGQTNRAQESSGGFSLTLSDSGAYSASLTRGSSTYPLAGQFDVAGQASKVVSPTKTNTWMVAMGLDFAAQQLRGWVSNGVRGGWVANLQADRAVFDARTNPATQYVGKYTLSIPGGADPQGAVWVGDGYLTLSVDTGGKLNYSGSLADGTSVGASSAPVSGEGFVPLYLPLYSGKGSVWSWLAFDTNQPTTGLEGALSWIKPAGAAPYYPAGFTNDVMAEGARYTPPTNAASRVIQMTNGLMSFEGGNLSLPLTNAVMLTQSNKVIDVSLTNKLTFFLTVSNGVFSGSVREPGLTKSNLFKGVLLQDESSGYGYFLETNRSGRVLFWPAP